MGVHLRALCLLALASVLAVSPTACVTQDLMRATLHLTQAPTAQTPTLRNFFMVNDLHLDPLYSAKLDTKTWCRVAPGQVEASPAMFGRIGCDAPEILLESTFQAMQTKEKAPDFILVAGDLAAHSLETPATRSTLQRVADLLSRYFPSTTIIPAIGNNDLEGHNKVTVSWFKELADAWKKWYPALEGSETFLKGGYYVAKPSKGLAVVVLNTSMYQSSRVLDKGQALDKDPFGQLAWLRGVLQAAKGNGEKVIVSGHVPPGASVVDVLTPPVDYLWHDKYVAPYQALVAEYADVVTAQLFAHCHVDQFSILTEDAQQRATSVILENPAVSPVYRNNPTFRHVFLDKNGAVVDYDEHYMELDRSNVEGKAEWKFEYDFNKAYNMDAPGPKEMQSLYEDMQRDGTLYAEWLARRVALYSPLRLARFCSMGNVHRRDFDQCAGFGSK